MKPAAFFPKKHVFVCVNARAAGDPLGPGCGVRGEKLYAGLKARVAQAGATAKVWVTRTYCQGLCPKRGASVSCQPEGGLYVEVEEEDLAELCKKLEL